jgi:hypothetical protein
MRGKIPRVNEEEDVLTGGTNRTGLIAQLADRIWSSSENESPQVREGSLHTPAMRVGIPRSRSSTVPPCSSEEALWLYRC